ncbi:GNAT family N-acetyltransferase [Roseobacter sinensis]|uniref:GNAT family N-acetyltransferase n=1 Tax=Roseobacter sinensis TaxID=2931391 RepID=A0ABT3BCW0_9RHOB|nr:GNAT family N-acetyltransferase [Roseobacter sp. WL0113]MCV3270989.1 GNAT family N-acetyltransferase [Roseobacter sp. WL0113]
MKSPSEPSLTVRLLTQQDADALTALYNELTFGPKTACTHDVLAVLAHPGTTIHGALAADRVIGMVTLHILPNVTWDGRPYALIENVATAGDWRWRGIGRRVMQSAIDHARTQKVYKIMLLTGQKRGARGFYEALGFDCEDKHGMVMRWD